MKQVAEKLRKWSRIWLGG